LKARRQLGVGGLTVHHVGVGWGCGWSKGLLT
jgi:hypothetical protein